MDNQISGILESLNSFIKKKAWLDFELLSLRGGTVIIVGSTDFTYFHELEVKFDDVFFIHCNTSWKTDTSYDVFVVPTLEEERKINFENSIEEGHFLIKIISDFKNSFYISAKQISVSFERVHY
jgi:hypothetical protein